MDKRIAENQGRTTSFALVQSGKSYLIAQAKLEAGNKDKKTIQEDLLSLPYLSFYIKRVVVVDKESSFLWISLFFHSATRA